MKISDVEIESIAAKRLGISRQALHKVIMSGRVSPAAWKRSGRSILVDVSYFEKLYSRGLKK